MSLIERFSGNIYGGITFTGNSLMVSKRKDARPLSELSDSCSFITTDLQKKFKDFPEGTTENYELNSSTAPLMLPSDAYVVFAELIWGGTYKTTGGGIPEELLDSKIKFTLPDSSENEIEPAFETRTSLRFAAADVYSYTRSAVVTEFVRENGSGLYKVGAVPAYFAPEDNLSQAFASAGWSLCVIYRRRNTKVALKNISFYVGALPVNEKEKRSQTFSGFKTLKETKPKASVLLSACCGDIDGENSVAFSHDENADFIPICGPNNLRTHFFASQINNSNGFLETNGTFGKYNHFLVGSEYVGSDFGRQGWDITEIDISHLVKEEKTSSILKFAAEDDRFIVNAAALCIDTDGEESDFSKYNFTFLTKEPTDSSIKTFNIENPVVISLSDKALEESINVKEAPSQTKEEKPMFLNNKSKISQKGAFMPITTNEENTVSAPKEEVEKSEATASLSPQFFAAIAQQTPTVNKVATENSNKTATFAPQQTQNSTPKFTPASQNSELFSQSLIERLYTYNIKEITNYSINYDCARVVYFGTMPVLTQSYTINLCYIDATGKKTTSVKRGTVSFMDISLSAINSCTIRICPVTAQVCENEVIFRASVKVYSVKNL